MDSYARYHRIKKITLVSALSNAVLSILKIFFGIFGHSQALFADGINSFSDVFTDLLLIFAARTGTRAPDSRHPYGHGRIETVFTMILAAILIIVAAGLVYDSIDTSFLHPSLIKPNIWTLVIAIISITFNELLYYYMMRISARIHSNMLKASAWHHRGDALSSIVVLLGIGGSLLGNHYFDGIAAIIVAVIIFRMGVKMAWSSVQEMMDAGVDLALVQQLCDATQKVTSVKSAHQLRTRVLGGAVFVDLHVQVDPRISVSEGHFVGEQVQKQLISQFSEVSDVTVHVDSEDDELAMISILAPDRKTVEQGLGICWGSLPGYLQRRKINLHYLEGKVEVEFFLPLTVVLNKVSDSSALCEQYRSAAAHLDYLGKIELCFFC